MIDDWYFFLAIEALSACCVNYHSAVETDVTLFIQKEKVFNSTHSFICKSGVRSCYTCGKYL